MHVRADLMPVLVCVVVLSAISGAYVMLQTAHVIKIFLDTGVSVYVNMPRVCPWSYNICDDIMISFLS